MNYKLTITIYKLALHNRLFISFITLYLHTLLHTQHNVYLHTFSHYILTHIININILIHHIKTHGNRVPQVGIRSFPNKVLLLRIKELID